MTSLAVLFVQTAQVEPFTGTSGFGDEYGAPVHVACFLDDGLQLLSTAAADTVVSRTVLYAALADADLFTVDSRVTVDGQAHRVTGVHRRSLGAVYSAANHVQVDLT